MKPFSKTTSFLLFTFLFCSFQMQAQIITTVAGNGFGTGPLGDGGPATSASIGYFGGLAVDKFGNIYIADGNHQRIRKVDAITGIISTVAGTGTVGYNGDGIMATTAQLNNAGIICVDTNGNLYIGDGDNFRIRKVDITTGIISTFAGNGSMGDSGDSGLATNAEIAPCSIVCDRFGNMYLSDAVHYKVRKIDPSGIITTIAGTGIIGNSGDGGSALNATFNPNGAGMGTDHLGNLYIVDSGMRVRKIDVSSGIVTRVAGRMDSAGKPYSGNGLLATECHIFAFAVALDDSDNIYLADYNSSRIEKIDVSTGIINAIAGTGVSGFSGDSGLAINAQLSMPENVALDKCNNVYIADFNNKRVRKITYRPCPDTTTFLRKTSARLCITIYPNPTSSILHIDNIKTSASYTISNILGSTLKQGSLQIENNSINISSLPQGIYFVGLSIDGDRIVKKIVKE